MSRIAVFRPTEPAAQSLTVVLQLYVGFPVPFRRRTAEVLLYAFPDKRLVMVKYEAYKVQSPSVPVGTVIPDRKHLLVPFQVQLQVFHVFPYVCKKPVKLLFARCKVPLNSTPQEQPTFFLILLLEIVPVPVTPQCYPAWELAHLLNLFQDIQDVR